MSAWSQSTSTLTSPGSQLPASLSWKLWTSWREGRTSIPAMIRVIEAEGYHDSEDWLVEWMWVLEDNVEEGRAQPWE